jgi:sugar phosphate permease
MGMTKSLAIHGQDFSWMATAFFIAYAVAEFPQGYLLHKFPVSKILGVNVLLWGVMLCCTAAAQDFADMVALRSLLGAFESIITPALVLITTQCYVKKQAAPRTGVWYCGLGLGRRSFQPSSRGSSPHMVAERRGVRLLFDSGGAGVDPGKPGDRSEWQRLQSVQARRCHGDID